MAEPMLSAEFEPAEHPPLSTLRSQSRQIAGHPLMRGVADTTPAYIVILNSDRQIVFANRSVLERFSYDLIDSLGLRIGDLMGCRNAVNSPDGCGSTKYCSNCGAAKAINATPAGGLREEECRIVRDDGDPIELEVTTTPFAMGGQQFTLLSAIDVADAKRRRVLERIFFHDIMNTATGVRGLSSMARVVEAAERDSMLDLLESASDRLIDEIAAQRELLAAETDELVPRPQPIDSRRLLTDVGNVYESHDVAVGKSIEVSPASEDVRFVSDPILLGRVVGNLVKNALEATRKGGTITVNCSQIGSVVEFSVHNEAAIPPATQLQIFQRSFTTKGNGRGLGTFGSRLLTERYLGGDIRFESAAGHGTTFTVSLPIILPAIDDQPTSPTR